MRREHKSEQSYIDWLKSFGCILYFPFSESGDLTDRISGNNLILTGYGSLGWNNSINMMSFNLPQYGRQLATFDTGWSNSTFQNNSTTVLATGKRISTSGYWNTITVGNNVPFVSPFNCQSGQSITSNFAAHNDNINKFGSAIDDTKRVTYYNGSLLANLSPYSPQQPWNWGGFQLRIGAYDGNASNKQFYLKDYMIFNTELDLQTIRKIQGYE